MDNINNGQMVADAIMKQIISCGNWPLTSLYFQVCPLVSIRTAAIANDENYALVLFVQHAPKIRTMRYYYNHNTREIYGFNANGEDFNQLNIPIDNFASSIELIGCLNLIEKYLTSTGTRCYAVMHEIGVDWLKSIKENVEHYEEYDRFLDFDQYYAYMYDSEYIESILANIIERQEKALIKFDKVTEENSAISVALEILELPIKWEIESMLSQFYYDLNE